MRAGDRLPLLPRTRLRIGAGFGWDHQQVRISHHRPPGLASVAHQVFAKD
jgi:hypothetical protein